MNANFKPLNILANGRFIERRRKGDIPLRLIFHCECFLVEFTNFLQFLLQHFLRHAMRLHRKLIRTEPIINRATYCVFKFARIEFVMNDVLRKNVVTAKDD